jgi:hypothetical protein
MKIGWLQPPLGQKWGGRATPFWPRGGWSHPHGRSGVVEPPPGPRGWSGHPQKAQKKKKKKKNEKWVLDFCGWPDHPQGLGGGPLRPVWGVQSHPRPLGVVRPPPKSPKPIFRFFFFFFFFFFVWPFGLARPPPWAWGWLDHPRSVVGVAPTTRPPHFGQGVAPKFHLFFFFFFFFFFDSHLFKFFFFF